LAAQGVMFTDAHSTSALSTPSRYSVLTGRYPWRTTLKQGVLGGFSDAMIAPDRSTVASALSNLGYETACIGKWHLGWHWAHTQDGDIDLTQAITEGPTTRGFDYFFGISASLDMAPYIFVENDRATETRTRQMPRDKGVHLIHGGLAGEQFRPEECLPELTRRAVAHIATWKGSGRPHFLYLPLTAPHTPCLPSPEFKGRTGLGDYGDFVAMMDDVVGQVIEAVRRSGQLSNTVIVFASDNGCAPYADTRALEAAGHYPSYIYRGYKSDIFEGGHRIPLVVYGRPAVDRRHRGTMAGAIVTLADLYATFVEIAGGASAGAEDSFSLVPLLRGGKAPASGSAGVHALGSEEYIISVSGNGWFSIRDRRYKLIFTPGSGGWAFPNKPEDLAGLPDRQLYDIVNNPGETVNLIDDPALQGDIARLTEKLREFILNGRSIPEGRGDSPNSGNDTPHLWRQTEPVFRD
ncbi:MAG: arylsulfatase, partial [Bacteroidales bacterium]|nr:arylsulfatase [Bacteroidales bacterium]